MTEWKLAKDRGEAKTKFIEARTQAQLYAAGPLHGTDLTTYRFPIVVSLSQVDVLTNEVVDGVVMRHVNIAIDPTSPSQAARRTMI